MHRMVPSLRMLRHIFIAIFLICSTSRKIVVLALPAGFEDENVIAINQVVDMAFADNILLAVTKDGSLYTYDLADPNAQRKQAADLTDRVCTNGERGLGTVTVHPQFNENRWVYLYYTFNRGNTDCPMDFTDGSVNLCSRFVMKDDWTLDVDSELVLFRSTPLNNRVHNGGDMEFGVDGMLYITTGDGGERSLQFSQARHNLHGNIIRITDSGEIPSDNPYQGEGTARCSETGETQEGLICQEIFAYGLRNPFRFTMDPHSTDKVRFLVSDVGGKTWEEISVGGTDYAGANYGWPIQEGPCLYNSFEDCSIGDETEFTDPHYWYAHNSEEEGCAVGVAVPPPGSNWPAPYNDPTSFFFVDFVFGEINHVTEAAELACNTCTPPDHGFRTELFHQWTRPIGLKFGPMYESGILAGFALYYTFRESDIHVKRIVYKGGNNFSPTVTFSVDTTSVLVGGTIQFDASGTTDPDHSAAELTYFWNFGDGSPEQTGIVVSHMYNTVGIFEVTLTAVDPDNASGEASQTVSVGAPPTVEIISPAEGTSFAVGDVLSLVGAGSDHLGNALDGMTQLTWEVRQHHANHFHPFLDEGTVGNNFAISEAPGPEDFFAAGNSYLEILLTGTDKDGISATVSRTVMPKTVNIDFDSEPTGLSISLDDEILTMPQRVLSWEKHKLQVKIPSDQGDYVFVGWKEKSVQDNTIVVPAADGTTPLYVALFELAATEENPAPAPAPAPTAGVPSPQSPTSDFPVILLTMAPALSKDGADGADGNILLPGVTTSDSTALSLSLWCLALGLGLAIRW